MYIFFYYCCTIFLERKNMCRVTSTELKKNLSYYLELSSKEDVCVTKNNKVISILTNPRDKNYAEFLKLRGCLANSDNGENYDQMIGKEILDKCGF